MFRLNKKIGMIIITILIIFIAGFSYYYFSRSKMLSPVNTEGNTVSPVPTMVEQLALWEDQSEFSFQYPGSLKLDPHDEDKENYAHVELTSATHSGNLIVWTQDTKASDNDDWIKREKIEGAIDTTLGSLPAKKFITGEEVKILTAIVIRNGYLYKIEAKLADSTYWNKVYDTVSSTYIFTSNGKNAANIEAQTQNLAPAAEESIEEYEEVVE